MAENVIFPGGMRMFKKGANAPDFIIASMVININEFTEWVSYNTEHLTKYKGADQLKLTIAFGKSGNPYVAVDTFKPKVDPEEGITPSQETKERVANAKEQRDSATQERQEELPIDDLPFAFIVPLLPLIGISTMLLSALAS